MEYVGKNSTKYLYLCFIQLTAYAEELAAANADVSVSTIGTSVEGRDIKMLTIGTGGKPVQFFDCMVHAREWIAGALCAWTANEVGLCFQQSIDTNL